MILKCHVKVKGVETIKDAEPGKPQWRVSLEGLEERKVIGSDEPELVTGNAKSYVQLEKGGEYLVEVLVGAYTSGSQAKTYMQIRKVIKGGPK